MQDRDMLNAPVRLYRMGREEPEEPERPPLSPRARLLMRVVGGGTVVALAVLFVFGGLPLLADKNGFALPVEHGLPWEFRYNGHAYRNTSVCARRNVCGDNPNYVTLGEIERRGHAPLVRASGIPTLFGLEHAAFAPSGPPAEAGASQCEQLTLYVQDGDRYLMYMPHGNYTTCGWRLR